MFMGPKCNHDLGILLRILCEDGHTAESATTSMLEAMGDHEHYCACYSSKDQPHIDGLLTTLADGLRWKEEELAKAKAAGEVIPAHEAVRRVLHRLMSSTNRRMHKGFPEMISYLLREPTTYCSHQMVSLPFEPYFRKMITQMFKCIGKYTMESAAHVKPQTDSWKIRLDDKARIRPWD